MYDATASITVCPLTTNEVEAPLSRIAVAATAVTGIEQPGKIMIDKITTVPRADVSDRFGRLEDSDLVRLNRALLVFLGLAD